MSKREAKSIRTEAFEFVDQQTHPEKKAKQEEEKGLDKSFLTQFIVDNYKVCVSGVRMKQEAVVTQLAKPNYSVITKATGSNVFGFFFSLCRA